MTLLEQYNKSSKDKATKILDDAIAKLQSMEATFANCFPHATLSAASTEFKTLNVESGVNEPVSNAVSMTIGEISAVSQGALNSSMPRYRDCFGMLTDCPPNTQMSELLRFS